MESTPVSVSESIFTSFINTSVITLVTDRQGSTNPPLKVDNVVNLILQVMNKTQATAELKRVQGLGYDLTLEEIMSDTYVSTDYVVTKGKGINPDPKRISLFKRVDGQEIIPYVLHHVEFMSARNEEDKDNAFKGSAFLYSVNNPLVPIGLIPTSALVRMCTSAGVKADQAHASLQYVVGSQAGIQFAPVGTVLSNGVVVDEDHEDYYITFCKVIFGTPFKNAVANIAGGVAMDTSSKYDDVDIFGIQ